MLDEKGGGRVKTTFEVERFTLVWKKKSAKKIFALRVGFDEENCTSNFETGGESSKGAGRERCSGGEGNRIRLKGSLT